MNSELTLENFRERTGFRFRINSSQHERIKAGTLTREQALAEFVAAGGVAKLKPRKPDVPDSVYLGEGLTLANFSERVKTATGIARRFRMDCEQCARHKNGSLTREQALAEVIATVRQNQNATNSTN